MESGVVSNTDKYWPLMLIRVKYSLRNLQIETVDGGDQTSSTTYVKGVD